MKRGLMPLTALLAAALVGPTTAGCPSGGCAAKASSVGVAVSDGCGVGSACAAKPVSAEYHAKTIGTAALAALVSSKAPVVILDARAGKYDDGRRIPGARTLTAIASAADAAKLIPSKDALVVAYCVSVKCPASQKLAKRLHELGYSNVLEYPPGIEGWVKAGQAVIGGPDQVSSAR